ncbi:hypothetical protein K7432_011821 [Basidiobolus ranarum]|uniref:NAD(P)-binding domain-containing protein n=1 Tax=Basidiobolus ranarum TaxID=34480 RepID=A0ABR2WLL4_9FUNG
MSQINTVAVASGNGGVGRFITKALIRSKYVVVILSRKTNVSIPGAKFIVVDHIHHSNLVKSLEGIGAVVSAVVGVALLEALLPLIGAALEAGVKRFVPSEYWIDQRDVGDLKSEYKALYEGDLNPKNITCKELIKHQDTLPWTSRNIGYFTDTTFIPEFGFDFANRKVTLLGDGNALVAWTSRYDVGEFVAAILRNPETHNQEITISADIVDTTDLLT